MRFDFGLGSAGSSLRFSLRRNCPAGLSRRESLSCEKVQFFLSFASSEVRFLPQPAVPGQKPPVGIDFSPARSPVDRRTLLVGAPFKDSRLKKGYATGAVTEGAASCLSRAFTSARERSSTLPRQTD